MMGEIHTNPQIIKTASGEELVVLTRHDYDVLLAALADAEEELADIAVLDERRAELASDGPSALLPVDVSAHLLQGLGRIAAIRRWRQMSKEQLAVLSGLDLADLEQVEARTRPTSSAEASRLAEALSVPIGWITD
jgi:hypothetical protein